MPTVLSRNFDSVSLCRELRALQNRGYIGILFEIVSANGGMVISSEQWNMLAESCLQCELFLVVDEALTAVRCGAPFAFQRPEYAKYEPSFILFGKGIRVSGLAVNPRGVMISKLGLDQQNLIRFCTLWADRLPSSVLPFPVLLESLGTLRLIRQKNLPERSERIGLYLRELL